MADPGQLPLPKVEKCLFGREEVELPVALIEDVNIFTEVFSVQTWQKVLTDTQRRRLLKYLPNFHQNDVLEKQQTLRALFGAQNFKFGSPLRQFHGRLKEGMFSPDVARYTMLCRKAKHKEYQYQQQMYYSNLLKEILVNRQRILETVYKTPIDEPLRLEDIRYKPPSKERSMQHKVKRRYYKILQEVNLECGADGISSDEDESYSSTPRSSKQPFKSSGDSPEDAPSTVLSTFAPIPVPALINGKPEESTVKRAVSPAEVTDDDFQEMLRKHKRRRSEGEEHPELETRNLTLQDIIMRTQPAKKGGKHSPTGLSGLGVNVTKKKQKDKGDKKKRRLGGKDEGSPEDILSQLGSMAVPGIPEDESAQDGMDMSEFSHDDIHETKMAGARQNFGLYAGFFGLLRTFITEEPEAKITTVKLEEKVREWQESASSSLNAWYGDQNSWVDQVLPALKFLSGDVLGLSMDNFIPFLDYKERAQQWKWIGCGRDTDEALQPFFLHWMENKESLLTESSESGSAPPPPPRIRTNYVVKPTSEEEKAEFQTQERDRFENPHRSFTYCLHGYESVVGPVKGVYNKESAVAKAREHALLVKERPSYVTILNLVRDAAARLPNGEGTRGDICELLKDSQFLAPGVSDGQLNTVVSGALDRLHYEKDPCVKYEVNKKLWIYLHRNRTEEECERIHQAQGAAAKAKKALQKPKPAKKIKETVQTVAAAAAALAASAASTPPSVPIPQIPAASTPTSIQASVSIKEESSLSVDSPSPISIPQSPRSQGGATPQSQAMSPRTPQMSPQPSTPQTSPKVVQSSPKSVTGSVSPAQGNSKMASSLVQMQQASPRSAVVGGKPEIVGKFGIGGKPIQPEMGAKLTIGSGPGLGGKPVLTSTPVMASIGKPLVGSMSGFGNVPAMGGKPVTCIGQVSPSSQGKPVSVTFLQPQAVTKISTPTTASMSSPQTQPALGGSKPMAFSLIHTQAGTKVVESVVQSQPRTLLLTSKPDMAGQQKVVITPQQLQSVQSQQVLAGANQTRPVTSSPKHPTPSASPKSSTPPMISTGSKPVMARIVQQMPAQQQVVTMGNLMGTSIATQKQPQTLPGATTIKIQGSSILQPQSGKPVTIHRVQSMDTSAVTAESKPTKVALQRTQSLETITPRVSTPTVESILSSIAAKTAVASSPQVTIGGVKPTKFVVGPQPTRSGLPSDGKPATLTTQAGAKSTAAVADIAHLVHSASMTGQPAMIGGKPIIIGGKPAMFSGKPIQISGKPIQFLQGKPGQIGLIQGQAGLMSTLNLVPPASSATATTIPHQRFLSQSVSATAPTLVSQILQAGGATLLQQGKSQVVPHGGKTQVLTAGMQTAGQPRILNPTQGGSLVVTQLPQGTAMARPGGVVRQTLLTTQGGKPSGIQVVKTVLSQPGGKPAQTTIVLAPPSGQSVQGTVVSADQLSQAGVKAISTGAKGKGGPVYARIITPPPGIRLAAVRPGQVTVAGAPVTSIPGVSVIQTTLGKLPGDLSGAQVVAMSPNITEAAPKPQDPENKPQ